MASQSKSDAARANGAKSHGPSTPEGKARSSTNALKHGLTARFKTLPGESPKRLKELIAAHQDLHQPVGTVEDDLAHTLAITRWRLSRLAALESALFENELCLGKEEIDKEFSKIDDLGRLAFVFQKLAGRSQILALLMRYESSLTRIYDRTFKNLLAIQKLRNEPKPANVGTPAVPSANSNREPMPPYLAALTAITLAASPTDQAFEVASVKPDKLGNAGGETAPREKITVSPGSLTMQNVSLQTCIKWAYGLRDFQISGPGWLASEKYQIAAKAPGPAPEPELRLMLRALLSERFKLKTHMETKEKPVYELVVAKNGPKLHAATGGDPSFGPSAGELVFKNYSMADLADRLSSHPFKLDLPVLDKTGLDGRYDFALKLASNPDELKHTLEGMDQGPSILAFFQDQLGLKLESRKGPVEMLIVESAAKIH
jgi:uncharacterized protein (TIGR03435 family)